MKQDERGDLISDDGTFYEVSGAGRAIGLTQDGLISTGYDSTMGYFDYGRDVPNEIYRKHRKEFAEFMIARWAAWRDEAPPELCALCGTEIPAGEWYGCASKGCPSDKRKSSSSPAASKPEEKK